MYGLLGGSVVGARRLGDHKEPPPGTTLLTRPGLSAGRAAEDVAQPSTAAGLHHAADQSVERPGNPPTHTARRPTPTPAHWSLGFRACTEIGRMVPQRGMLWRSPCCPASSEEPAVNGRVTSGSSSEWRRQRRQGGGAQCCQSAATPHSSTSVGVSARSTERLRRSLSANV